jgi:hypothetical protein
MHKFRNKTSLLIYFTFFFESAKDFLLRKIGKGQHKEYLTFQFGFFAAAAARLIYLTSISDALFSIFHKFIIRSSSLNKQN